MIGGVKVLNRCFQWFKDRKTRSYTDGFRENNAKCLKPKGICGFVPDSSIYGFWPFLGELG